MTLLLIAIYGQQRREPPWKRLVYCFIITLKLGAWCKKTQRLQTFSCEQYQVTHYGNLPNKM